jgi:hypothetical protein
MPTVQAAKSNRRIRLDDQIWSMDSPGGRRVPQCKMHGSIKTRIGC